MPGYLANGTRATIDTTDRQILSLNIGGTVSRIYLEALMFFCQSNVAWTDTAIHWLLRRFTGGAATGGSSGTVLPKDGADRAQHCACLQAATGGGTTPTTGFDRYQPLRLPFEWRCLAPGKEIVVAAAAGNGVETLASHAAWTGNVNGTFEFFE